MPVRPRNTAVNLIRLLALIGICIVNVVFLALPTETAMSPATELPDQIAAFIVEALFQAKFFLLFSFLFGWGIHIQMRTASHCGAPFARQYGRRLAGLAVIGVLHAGLVFTGDILLIYVLLGLIIWPMQRLTARALMRLGYGMIPLAVACLVALALMLPDQFEPVTGPSLGGSFVEASHTRLADWPLTFGFLMLFQGPLAFGAFAMGLAAGKAEFFAQGSPGSPGRHALRRLFPWLLLAGVPLNIAYAASMGELFAPEQDLLLLAGFAGIALGGPMLAAAYLHMMLVLNLRMRLPGVLIAAGQNSLSVYVLQGVIAGFVFGGHGLGLFNRFGFVELLVIGLLIAGLSVVAIGVVAARTGRGPLEALLRWVTYGQRGKRDTGG